MEKKDGEKDNINTLNVEIGQRLRQFRHEKDYTQENVADMLGMSQAFYGRIERGENGLTLERLKRLNEKLKIDLTYLITGEHQVTIDLDWAIDHCPYQKRFDMEQLIKYAVKLAGDEGR